MGIEGTYLDTRTAVYDKTICNRLKLKKLKAFWLKSGPRHGCPLSPLLVNTLLELLPTVIREKKGVKVLQIGRKRVKSL